MKGSLGENPLAELLREITDARLSGALRLARERVKAVIYAQGGAVVSARSNLRAHRLAECALRNNLVEAQRLASVVTEMMTDAEVAAALIGSRAIDGVGLSRLRVQQALDVMRPLLVLTDGEWDFDARARLAEDVAVRFDMQQLLLEGARHLPAEFAAARLADDDELISPASRPPDHLQLLPTEAFVLSRADAPARVCDLVALSGLPEAQTRHTIYALALSGFLARQRAARVLSAGAATQRAGETEAQESRASVAASAPDEVGAHAAIDDAPESPPDPRDEMNALLARANADDYYTMLGVARDAAAPDIKRAYYALAKRFHPDRFRRAFDDDETRTRIENAFAEIAHAYETLRDPRERANYDSKHAARISQPAPPVAAARKSDGARQDDEALPRGFVDPTSTSQYRAEESFQQGLAALQRGDAATAVPYFGEAVRLAPQQARYHALYGRALMSNAQMRRQAESELQRAITLDPQNASFHVTLAELYAVVGLTRRAEGELERALALDPQHVAARQLLKRMKGQR
jgi:curved DNA-binding protein CbpA